MTPVLIAAVPAAGLLATGYGRWLRRGPVFALALTLPPIVHAAFLLARGLVFSPRFFLLILLVVILAVVQTADVLARALTSRMRLAPRSADWGAGAAIVAVTALSLLLLPAYYGAPKQPYLEAMPSWLHYATSVAGAIFVVALGSVLARRLREAPAPIVELAVSPTENPSRKT